jgi:hypothetical protein
VLGSGQVIRIPANQSIVTGSNQVHQIQMPGRQVHIYIHAYARTRAHTHAMYIYINFSGAICTIN